MERKQGMARGELLALALILASGLLFSAGCTFDPVGNVGNGTESDGQSSYRDAWVEDGHLDTDADPNPSCVGTCQTCLPLGETDCGAVEGCSWNSSAACSGTCLDCSSFTAEQACNRENGCTWQVEWHCEGICRDCVGLDQETCAGVQGCTWGDLGDGCYGTPVPCGDIDRPVFCTGVPGCSWSVQQGRCKGDPAPCEGRGWSACYAGCDWGTVQGCMGTCTPCDGYQDQTGCEGQPNCAWRQAPPYCSGTCDPCENFSDSAACGGQVGCQWQQTGACQGTCRDCSTYGDRPSCESQPGCSWQAG